MGGGTWSDFLLLTPSRSSPFIKVLVSVADHIRVTIYQNVTPDYSQL